MNKFIKMIGVGGLTIGLLTGCMNVSEIFNNKCEDDYVKAFDISSVEILENEERYEEALEIVNAYLEKVPKDLNALEEKAYLQIMLYDTEQAIMILDEIIDVEEDWFYYHLRSRGYADLGLNELALRDAEQTVKLNSEVTSGFIDKANALYGLSEYEEAIDVYDKILELDNKEPIAYYGKALCLYEQDYDIEAYINFEKAFNLDKTDEDYYSGVIKGCYTRGYYKEMYAFSQEYIKAVGDNGNAYFYQAQAAYELGKYEEAIGSYNMSLKYSSYTADIYYEQSKAYLAIDNKEAAYGNLLKALKEDAYYIVYFSEKDLEKLEGYKDFNTSIGVLMNVCS